MFEKFLDKIDKLDEDENKKKDVKKTEKKEEPPKKESINWVGMGLELLSLIIAVVGIIWGIIMIDYNGIGVLVIIGSVVSALFIRALAEIINLLQDISDKLEK